MGTTGSVYWAAGTDGAAEVLTSLFASQYPAVYPSTCFTTVVYTRPKGDIDMFNDNEKKNFTTLNLNEMLRIQGGTDSGSTPL